MTFYPGLYLQVQTGGVDAETGKNLFYPGLYLQVQTGGVDAETGKNHDFISELYLSGANRRRGRRDRKKP
jgi:hypothetical protein